MYLLSENEKFVLGFGRIEFVLRLSINAQSSYRKFIILICNVVQEYLCHSCYNFDISSNELSRNVIMSRSAEHHEV